MRNQYTCAMLILAGVAGCPHVTRAQGPRVQELVAPTRPIRPWRPAAAPLSLGTTPIFNPEAAADSLKIRPTYWLEGGLAGSVGVGILGWFQGRAIGSVLGTFAGFFVGALIGGQVPRPGP